MVPKEEVVAAWKTENSERVKKAVSKSEVCEKERF